MNRWVTALLRLPLLLLAGVPAPAVDDARGICSNAADCSLGGLCVQARCDCDPAFSGPNCVALNLLPAPTTELWNRGEGTDSWGGNIVYDKGDNKWHLFFAELLNHCPLRDWGTNSVVSHATADSPMGPFVKKETLQPAFHHNPTVAYDERSGTFLLISIGNGSASIDFRGHTTVQNCTDPEPETSGRRPPLQADSSTLSDDRLDSRQHPLGAGIITLSHAPSANGPWTTLARPVLQGRPGKWDFFVTNPSVHIFANGSILMAYRAGNMTHGPTGGQTGIAVASSWRGEFRRISDKGPAYPDFNEDPGLFRDSRGNFHIISHYWTDGPGGHAFSADGLQWTFAGQAYGHDIAYANGSTAPCATRERPQVVTLAGKPALLFTGVTTVSGVSHTTLQPINQA